MTFDESAQIEQLLADWYDWQRDYFPPLGAGRVDPSCRGFTENDRHLDIEERTEAADRKAKRRQAEQVDLCVDALTWQPRAAIQTYMRQRVTQQTLTERTTALNAECGVTVRRVPRAFDFTANHVAYQEAKFALLPVLRRRSLMKVEHIA